MKRLKRSLMKRLSVLMAAVVMLSSVSTGRILADEIANNLVDYVLVKDPLDNPVTADTVIYKGDNIGVEYYFKELIPGDNILKGETYVLNIPDNIGLTSSASWKARVDGAVLCNCTYDSLSNTISVVFDDDVFENDKYSAGIDGAYIGFFGSVDFKSAKKGDNVSIEFLD